MNPQIRIPMERMYSETFYYHFESKPYLSYRKNTWLCFEVETVGKNRSLVLLQRGVFRNQTSYYAEMWFLSWFRENMPRNKNYRVTWYISWSPCAYCAEQVAEFLSAHPKVSLTIYAARLYYFWVPGYRQGLRRLVEEGARVEIMNYEEFDYCWKNFVCNNGKPIRWWVGLDENYEFLTSQLDEILRIPMERMPQKKFRFHFQNLHLAYDRNTTWLCFKVETVGRNCLLLKRGVFQNQVTPRINCHAEMCFLSWFLENMLLHGKHYQVTWFISWSPCADCAKQVAEFLSAHPKVSLTIYAARLYYLHDSDTQWGLRQLCEEGAHVMIMSYDEFDYCWENFVYTNNEPFEPWVGLHENYELMVTKLDAILG
ncbi:DNA dC-_dU-editing enzyme APOBEC-3C-like [Carlito syrichta]|uniref:single-stranded DNA cytosine deaminase n=1 Tax=Carlito syrichta TaxID=1868482 RepID=A0A3Q0DPF7_CARSF|nr:DNA dC->dU-editing enzyme APOBEC-3C-like [Carlito syrichta]